jgi:hypothetical protein
LGLRKFQQVWEAGQAVREQMVNSLNASETRTLLSLLQRVAESLGERAPELVTDRL